MSEERGGIDPTRRLLKTFGVTVTEYEERTRRILEASPDELAGEELLQLAGEAVKLTANLNAQLREMSAHVLGIQSAVLARVNTALQAAQASQAGH